MPDPSPPSTSRSRSKHRRWLIVAGLGLAAALVALTLQWFGQLERVEATTIDLFQRWQPAEQGDPRVAIVAVDAEAIDEVGRWPWPRRLMATLVDRLAADGARVIAFDVVFAERSRAELPASVPGDAVGGSPALADDAAADDAAADDAAADDAAADDAAAAEPLDSTPGAEGAAAETGLAGDDGALAAAIERAGNVVLAYFLRFEEQQEGRQPLRPPNISATVIDQVFGGPYPVPEAVAVEPNLDLFAGVADSQGFASDISPDGVVRRYPLVAALDDRIAPPDQDARGYYPALGLRAVQRFSGEALALAAGAGGLPRLRLGERSIAADERGRMWLDYRGPAGSFATVSAASVLDGTFEPGTFRDRLVLIGGSELGLFDRVATPLGGRMAGVEVHANAADMLLNGRFLHDGGDQAIVSLLAVFALALTAAALVAAIRRHLVGSLVAIALVAAWPAVCYLAFVGWSWHLQVVAPMLAGSLALVATLRYQVGFVERRARQIKQVFERYVSASIVEEMLADPDRVKLGGERREMTVLFADIRGFTTAAEKLPPEEVTALLNAFFTPMTRLVLAAGGTLDKYMGDALMAFFGAPVAQPDHAARACRAALAMVGELARLNREGPPAMAGLRLGIGINSGDMSVGNMGSEAVFDYTVIGDAVNLGSRIEGLNKLYGTTVLISGDTAAAVGGELLVRPVDRVQVKGKTVPVELFELLAERPATPELEWRAAASADAVAAYRRRDFDGALDQLEKLAAAGDRETGPDPLVEIYRRRCWRHLEAPPPEDWQAVEILTSK